MFDSQLLDGRMNEGWVGWVDDCLDEWVYRFEEELGR